MIMPERLALPRTLLELYVELYNNFNPPLYSSKGGLKEKSMIDIII